MDSEFPSYYISKESHPEKILTGLGLDKDNQIFYCTMKVNEKEYKVGIIVPANVNKDQVLKIFQSHQENIERATSERKDLKKGASLLTLHSDGSLTASKTKNDRLVRQDLTAKKIDENINLQQHKDGKISDLTEDLDLT